jgi:DNA repair protein RadA/Sms
MTIFVCKNCGYGAASWMGRCPDCGQWNSLVEKDWDEEPRAGKSKGKEKTKKLQMTPLTKIQTSQKSRLASGIYEFDRVLGGGFVPGEVALLTGEPGIGKSTLLLQTLKNHKTVYISGEESAEQVRDRADRLKIDLKNFSFSDTLQVEGIIEGLDELKKNVEVVIIDSIQTIYSKRVDSPPGAPATLKETATQLITFAKKNKITLIMSGHVTKEGEIAGPKSLEHYVDAVLNFEGEKVSNFRILRSSKNRFGGTDEIGIFEMKPHGLTPVSNSVAFLEGETDSVPGRAIVGVAEGRRPLFFEIQTLTVPTVLAVPRRVVRGVDYNKVQLLLAVMRKNLGLALDKYDIYVNVVGGVTIRSTAADLGIIASLISSLKNISLPKNTVFSGEVGLLGEIRKGFMEEKIATEAKRLKFKKIISSQNASHIKNLRKVISL